MSYSSLYGIRNDYTGEELSQYKNSFLFSPMIWNVLSDKHLLRDSSGNVLPVVDEVWFKINDYEQF